MSTTEIAGATATLWRAGRGAPGRPLGSATPRASVPADPTLPDPAPSPGPLPTPPDPEPTLPPTPVEPQPEPQPAPGPPIEPHATAGESVQ
jgi:hypothetical protein